MRKKIYFTTEEEKINAANKFSDEDIEQLRHFSEELTFLKENGTITMENVQKLDNLVNQLLIMRSRHVFSLMNWLKQKFIVDA
tara:strand:+ start:1485 stop:1733 length:249 start_codon:yes stop_codon:yes gene_type:complete